MTFDPGALVTAVGITVVAMWRRPIRSSPGAFLAVAGIPIIIAILGVFTVGALGPILGLAAVGWFLIASLIEHNVLGRRLRRWTAEQFDLRLHQAITQVVDAIRAVRDGDPEAATDDQIDRQIQQIKDMEVPTPEWAAIRDSYAPPLRRALRLARTRAPVEELQPLRAELDEISIRRQDLVRGGRGK